MKRPRFALLLHPHINCGSFAPLLAHFANCFCCCLRLLSFGFERSCQGVKCWLCNMHNGRFLWLLWLPNFCTYIFIPRILKDKRRWATVKSKKKLFIQNKVECKWKFLVKTYFSPKLYGFVSRKYLLFGWNCVLWKLGYFWIGQISSLLNRLSRHWSIRCYYFYYWKRSLTGPVSVSFVILLWSKFFRWTMLLFI